MTTGRWAHTPTCRWYEQAEDGAESCDCGAAGRTTTRSTEEDEPMSDHIKALRKLGPDVGETEPTVAYVDPDLERLVMEAITRYPSSGLNEDGTTHGLAAVAAITTVEKWLLERGVGRDG